MKVDCLLTTNLKMVKDKEIFDFMEVNAHKLREVSMRMALKIADLFKVTGVNDWRTLAESTCMKVR